MPDRPQPARCTTPRVDFPWTLAIAVAAVIATSWAGDVLVADAARVRDGQVWRLITGPFVHATWGHLLRDLCVGGIAGIAYEQPLRRWWPALCALALVVPAAVVLLDGAAGYAGLSGVSHAFIAAALGLEARRRRGRVRVYVLALAAIGAVKLGYEVLSGAPAFPMDLGPGVEQAPLAHAAGVVVGAVIGLIAGGRAARQAASKRAGSGGASMPSTSDAASWPDDQPTCAQ